MEVTYFRPRRPGPECEIEEVIVGQIAQLFQRQDHVLWVAGSLSVGAGMPDLIIVTSKQEVLALSRTEPPSAEILAYLRVVRGAGLSTIADRVARPRRSVARWLGDLVEARAVFENSGLYGLNPLWHNVLPDVVTVEAKVSKWQQAVSQAARNRLFAHRSYVALPGRLTDRVRAEPVFRQLGIGILAARDDGNVLVARRPKRRPPRIWAYYYRLALFVAAHSRS